jgi:cytochrome c peroxidase
MQKMHFIKKQFINFQISINLKLLSLMFIFAFSNTSAASGVLATVGSELYYPYAYGASPSLEQLTAIGRKIFFDKNLSASGKLSCSSCHSPDNAYGSPNHLMTQLGGAEMNRKGFRNTPSLTYLHSPINFTEHFYEPEVTGGQDDEGPTGGRTWDGRVNSGHEQALIPLLDNNEMANSSISELVGKFGKSNYAEQFREVFSQTGENVFDNADAVLGWMTLSLEVFEHSPNDFHPFTSKYDAYLRDEAKLNNQEKKGLDLFNNIKKGNCASCHTSTFKNTSSSPPMFTDFGYVATAAPRNKEIASNTDANFYDLGLCGPLRTDLSEKTQYCGMFRTPTLRNVALRKTYFHNGVFHTLKEVLDFYVTRDIAPQKWYSKSLDGKTVMYDDLPLKYHSNINKDIPFSPLAGNKPRLSKSEINDVIAFLNTLTDGFTPDKLKTKKQ